MRAILALAGLGFIGFGVSLTPDSAIHEIYQLNAISTGLVLFGIVGVRGAIDRLREDPEKE